MLSPPCALSDVLSTVTNVTNILEFEHVSLTISRAPKGENEHVNLNYIVQYVEYS